MGSRIELTDTKLDVFVKMADGNPGAVTAIMEILAKGGEIDPQGMLGGLGAVMLLDTWEIYGSDIYILFNDKCDRNVRKMMVLLRATQLGIMPVSELSQMSRDQSRSIGLDAEEWDKIDGAVCEQLEDFQKPD